MKNNDCKTDYKTEDNNENNENILMSDYLTGYEIIKLENAGFNNNEDFLDVPLIALTLLKGFGFINAVDLLCYLKAINKKVINRQYECGYGEDLIIIVENILGDARYYDSEKIARMTVGDIIEIAGLTENLMGITLQVIFEHYCELFRIAPSTRILTRDDALNNVDSIFTYKKETNY